MTTLITVLIVLLILLAVSIMRLVRDLNERFDQIEHKLDVIIDQTDKGESVG